LIFGVGVFFTQRRKDRKGVVPRSITLLFFILISSIDNRQLPAGHTFCPHYAGMLKGADNFFVQNIVGNDHG